MNGGTSDPILLQKLHLDGFSDENQTRWGVLTVVVSVERSAALTSVYEVLGSVC